MEKLLADHEVEYIGSCVYSNFDLSGIHFVNVNIEVDRRKSEVVASTKAFSFSESEKNFAIPPNDVTRYSNGKNKYHWTHEKS